MTQTLEAETKTQTLTGAEILVRALVDQGVDTIFGYPGGAVLPIYDALFHEPRLRHVLVRHEQGATHAAEGYARSTGKPGVVLVTSGPGATNAVTGIVDALMDSIPLVVITGQVATHLIGSDAFQEADTVGITRSCTKHNYLVKNVNDLARVVHEAFHIATSGRPGPVVIDIPKDVQFMPGPYVGPEEAKPLHSYNPRTKGDAGKIAEAMALLVAHKNVTQARLVEQGVVDRQNRAAWIAEKDLDALVHQRAHEDLSARQGLGLDFGFDRGLGGHGGCPSGRF